MGILTFEEGYVERMWGGRRLADLYGKRAPADKAIGEAWLIADHTQHESVVSGGPEDGRALSDLLDENAERILGSRPRLTVHGRFPLLLKLLDAGDKLSIQVHPNDEDAKRFDEPDAGKTEMWYVLHAEDGGEVFCGMSSDVARETFEASLAAGEVAQLLTRIEAAPGTAVFVPAGTVHAIGGGCVLAEIQQNSDVTYRIDDWGRVQDDGTPRELHIEKALEVIRWGASHSGPAEPLERDAEGARISVLAACRYFAAERIEVEGAFRRTTDGASFHLLLGIEGALGVEDIDSSHALTPGVALMVPGESSAFTVTGRGAFLDYYVPDLAKDIIGPLERAGHPRDAVVRLGGHPSTSDLAF